MGSDPVKKSAREWDGCVAEGAGVSVSLHFRAEVVTGSDPFKRVVEGWMCYGATTRKIQRPELMSLA
jgi:hypothetical protein